MNLPIDELEALRWLKETAAAPDPLPTDAESRVWAKVAGDLNAQAIGQLGVATSLSAPSARIASGGHSVVLSRLAMWSAPALVLGVIVGVAGHAALTTEKVVTVYVERPESTLAINAPVADTKVAPEPPTEPVVAPQHGSQPGAGQVRTSASASSSTSPHAEGALARERAVLDPARAALAAGNPALALERVKQHAHQFPSGLLSEEREAIAINALVQLGGYQQAEKRAELFHSRYPQSLMTHSVDAAMTAIPR